MHVVRHAGAAPPNPAPRGADLQPRRPGLAIRGAPAQPAFDDSRPCWFPQIPHVGVKVPNAGVRMRVLEQNGTTITVRISTR